MPQEFHVLRCCTCETFQVQQVKKVKKWTCKMCGEKQSVLKVYGQGTGVECRKHVQTLNMLRGEKESMAAQGIQQPGYEAEFTIDVPGRRIPEEMVNQREPAAQRNKWAVYVEEEDEGEDEDEEEELPHSTAVQLACTTDRGTFETARKESRKMERKHNQRRHGSTPAAPYATSTKASFTRHASRSEATSVPSVRRQVGNNGTFQFNAAVSSRPENTLQERRTSQRPLFDETELPPPKTKASGYTDTAAGSTPRGGTCENRIFAKRETVASATRCKPSCVEPSSNSPRFPQTSYNAPGLSETSHNVPGFSQTKNVSSLSGSSHNVPPLSEAANITPGHPETSNTQSCNNARDQNSCKLNFTVPVNKQPAKVTANSKWGRFVSETVEDDEEDDDEENNHGQIFVEIQGLDKSVTRNEICNVDEIFNEDW